VQSALLGQPLVMATPGLLQTSASDPDGTVANIKTYLDGILVDNNTWSTMYEYTWSISDTTKYHTVKVVVSDNEGETAADSVNFELYGSKWIQTANLGQYAGGEKYAFVFQNKLWLYLASLGVFATSEDGASWTEVTNSLPWVTGGNLLQQELNGKIWLIKGSTLWSSADCITWDSTALVKEKEPDSELFVYGNYIHFLYLNNTYPNESDWSTEVARIVTDHAEFVSSLHYFFNPSSFEAGVITNGNNIYIMDHSSTQKTYSSSDCLNWNSLGVLPPYTWLNTQYVYFNERITGISNMNEMTWSSSDGTAWTKEYLIHPTGYAIDDAVVYNGFIWLFDDPGHVYCLKKYFD